MKPHHNIVHDSGCFSEIATGLKSKKPALFSDLLWVPFSLQLVANILGPMLTTGYRAMNATVTSGMVSTVTHKAKFEPFCSVSRSAKGSFSSTLQNTHPMFYLPTDDDGLAGELPPEIGHLSKLENLIVKNNPGLAGTLPTTLGHLPKLAQLGLYNNNIAGTIPGLMMRATALKYINLEKNNLEGSIPLGIQNLGNLHTLILMDNKLEGVVPMDQLAKTSVQYLGLSNNRFSSMLEKSLGDIETLEYLYLDNNQMRSHIPVDIGKLTHLSKSTMYFTDRMQQLKKF